MDADSPSPEIRPSSELAGKTAIVTGGCRGIGRAVADALGAAGASLVLGYRAREDTAHQTKAELERAGVAVELVRADLTEPSSPQMIVDTALQRFGGADYLVNNAGINRDATLRKQDRESYDEVLNVNFTAAVLVAQAAAERMIEVGFGRIVSISSFVGQKGNFGQANYAASKAALIGWTKTAALEWARYGITVNVVCPGFIETSMLDGIPEKIRERLLDQIPLARFGRPEEIADAVLFALRADYMTGAQLNVNGGIYM